MQASDCPHYTFADGAGIEGPGTLILHINAPNVPLAMLRLGRHVVREKRVIGYWAWELPDVASGWRHRIRR